MKNKYRYDGEMPPEIAAQFPVGDQSQNNPDESKAKAKRTAMTGRYMTAIRGLAFALVVATIVLMVIFVLILVLYALGVNIEALILKFLFVIWCLICLVVGSCRSYLEEQARGSREQPHEK